MEDGKALAKDVLPFVAARLKDAANANGALELALKGLNVKLAQSKAGLQIFQESLFNDGIRDGLSFLLNGFNSLMDSSTILSKVLGGLFKGAVVGLTLPFRALYAIIFDITKWMDLHDLSETNSNLVAIGSTVLGLVVGLGGVILALNVISFSLSALTGIIATVGVAINAGWLVPLLAVLTTSFLIYAAIKKIADIWPDFNVDLGRKMVEIEAIFSKDAEKLLANEARVGGFTPNYDPDMRSGADMRLMFPELTAAKQQYAQQQADKARQEVVYAREGYERSIGINITADQPWVHAEMTGIAEGVATDTYNQGTGALWNN